MSIINNILNDARSPLDLDRAAKRRPLSVHDEAVQLAAAGAKAAAAPEHLAAWRELSRSAFPSVRPARFFECSGRGSGKSARMAAAAALAVLRPTHDKAADLGTRVTACIVAPRLKQAAEVAIAAAAVLRRWAPLGIKFHVRGEGSEECELVIDGPRFACPRAILILPEGDALRSRAFCFVGTTESGHHRDLAATVKAAARLAQFANSQLWCEGTPGRPEGFFYDNVEGSDLLNRRTIARGSSFLLNPRHMPLERCREVVPDERDFATEILATRWGARGEGVIDAEPLEDAPDVRGDYVPHVHPDATVTAADLGHGDEDENGKPTRGDASAIVQAAPLNEVIRDGAAPVTHCVVTRVESMRGTRDAPLRTEEVVARMVAIAAGGPLILDRHYQETVSALLKDARYTEFKIPKGDKRGFRNFRGRKFHFADMGPEVQEARFTAVRGFVHGRRFHVPDTKAARALLTELASLTATKLASGTRYQARHDDLAKALSLCMSVFPSMTPAFRDGHAGALSRVPAGVSFTVDEGRFVADAPARWIRTMPNGRAIPAEPPPGTEDFRRAVIAAVDSGNFSPGMIRWIESRGFRATPALDTDALFDDRRPLNIPVRGND